MKTICFKIKEKIVKELEEYGLKNDRSLSSVIRIAVKNFLESKRRNKL